MDVKREGVCVAGEERRQMVESGLPLSFTGAVPS